MILWWQEAVPATKRELPTKNPSLLFSCPLKTHCRGEGAFVADKFARRANVNIEVYDIRPSKALPGYFHLSFRLNLRGTSQKGPIQIIVTNGDYMVPVMIRVSPAEKGNPSSILNGPPPTNVFFEEEDMMFVARPDLSNAIHLIGNKSQKSYLLVVDSLWGPEFADLVDMINEVFKSRKEAPPTLYLVPVFGLFSSYTAEMGRYFYALLDLGLDPLQLAYNFSKAGHEIKGFPEQLYKMSLVLLKEAFPKESEEKLAGKLKEKLRKLTGERVIKRSGETAGKVGVPAIEYVIIYNDRIYHYPNLLGFYDQDFKKYFAKKLFGRI